ncbi:MAG: hypothetical protein L0Z50_40095 [Verrucomicrobiales bacterium]|nr:hypothetical protein [Verrucomicrobiales bacterium]
MTPQPKNYEELTKLISALLEGRLTERERTRLEALLQADSQARRLYMQMIDQEVELSCLLVPADVQDHERAKILPLIQCLPEKPILSSPKRWPRWRLAAAAAVLLLFGTVFAVVVSRDHFWEKPADAPQQPITNPRVPDKWIEDFEQGLLRGWVGTLVTSNLPPGSQYGIAAVVREDASGGDVRVIQLPEDWHRGLFALTTESALNLTYRIANRGHVNVFMHTIPSDPGVNGYHMYQLGTAPFWSAGFGEWRTVSIPFSQFARKVVVKPRGTREFVGGPPQPGELVTTLSFSSMEKIEFFIDRVWVTPMGKPREEITPVRNSPSP